MKMSDASVVRSKCAGRRYLFVAEIFYDGSPESDESLRSP